MLMILTGQKGRLIYLAEQAGIEEADIASIQWQQQSGAQNVLFTAPNLVEGIAVGLANMRCRMTDVLGQQTTYKFQIECREAEPSRVIAPVYIEPFVP